jgi:NADH:ubiquinone oxidoreductase subunit
MIALENFLVSIVSRLKYVDKYGNRYYTSIFGSKRFVTYAGIADPATIPPKYYLWLHKLIDDVDLIEDNMDLIKEKFSDKIKNTSCYSKDKNPFWSPK